MKNNILLDIEEMTDSKEIILKRIPSVTLRILRIIIIGVIVFILWAHYGKIDTYIKAYGEIRPEDNVVTVTARNGGKIKKIAVQDGQNVKQGDTLFEFDNEYANLQKDAIAQQIKEKRAGVECYQKLSSSILQNKNLMDKETESIYYYEYNIFDIQAGIIREQDFQEKEKVYIAQEEMQQEIEQIGENTNKAIALYKEYGEFYDIVSKDEEYEGKNQTITGIYEKYLLSKNQKEEIYESYVSSYEDLLKQNEEEPGKITEFQLRQALSNQNIAYADFIEVKSNLLIEVNSMMVEIKNQIEVMENDAEKIEFQSENLSYQSLIDLEIEKLKNEYYINIEELISALNQDIFTLETELLEIEESIKQSEIVAERAGIFVSEKEYAEGDIIVESNSMGTIIPDEGGYSITIYIPEYAITEIKKYHKVEYVFDAVSSAEFGKVYGEIESISADSFTNPNTGEKYYRAKGTIDRIVLKNKKGDYRKLEIGMQAEVHAITGEQSVLSWILDKIGIDL